MFTNNQFQCVKRWLYRNARPLDLARFQYHFEDGPASAVITALEAYQNSDGGFGNTLEADCWNPNSSPLQTWWATQFLKEINFHDVNHPMIKGIITYLASGDGTAKGRWQFSIPSNNDHPRAPWWTYSENDESPGYNPTAALAGYILAHTDKDNPAITLGKKLKDESLSYYLSQRELTEMHELACFIELYDDLSGLGLLGQDDKALFKKKLKDEVYATIEQDSSKWQSEYCCKPSHLFKSPDSMFYSDNQEIMADELNHIIHSLSPEGTWSITWEWGDFGEAFGVSKRWWQGNLAINNLLMLKDFGLLEL